MRQKQAFGQFLTDTKNTGTGTFTTRYELDLTENVLSVPYFQNIGLAGGK
jgi:hypothetical protein